MALHDPDGDHKLPDASRKITACVACRKLKIKCHMINSKPPCRRCKTRGLNCTLNKNLQTLMEDDVIWKENIEERIRRLESAAFPAQAPPQPNAASMPSPAINAGGPMASVSSPNGNRTASTPSSVRRQDNKTPENMLNLSCSLGSFPASSMLPSTAMELEDPARPDLISSGHVSLKTATDSLAFFKLYLDPFVFHSVGFDTSLQELRSRSSLLTAAVCTVAAYCTSSEGYQTCLEALKLEASHRLFADNLNPNPNAAAWDDVLGLCIAAFWLSEVSANLVGLAVSMGTQLQLHRCITRMPHKDLSCYQRTRLWYLLFLCDHQCSLMYGVPAKTRELSGLKIPAVMLQSQHSDSKDIYLISQVELWAITRNVFETFGGDVNSTLASQRPAHVHGLIEKFDNWYSNSMRVLKVDTETHSLQRRLVDFYYHSGKLFLLSHLFRGRSNEGDRRSSGPPDLMDQAAFDSAVSIVQVVTDWPDSLGWLSKFPTYFTTMIAFACVCLVRIALQQQLVSDTDAKKAVTHLQRLVQILRRSSNSETSRQPLVNLANSLDAALGAHNDVDMATAETQAIMNADFDWTGFMNDCMDFDLLSGEALWNFNPDPDFTGGWSC